MSKYLHLLSYFKNIVKNLKFKNEYVIKYIFMKLENNN